MSQENRPGDDALEEERRLREQEESVKDQEPAERAPADRHPPDMPEDNPAPPGQAEQPRG
jgi:hypothetical protein